ncbi:Gfo/Idh/MocA family protein [Cohnella cellulosilytica]|uniref:Gfo/Idh/MocA family protein n=1 Tax=Cohnella cellulosilytica TaxID=986710 RepID=A0ABW2FIT9_9BACL
MPIKFSLIGGAGFRAQYFLRIAEALPDRFEVSGMVVRNASKAEEMERRWGAAVYPGLEELLAKEKPDFVVVSVNGAAGAEYMLKLAREGIPVLMETPPAADLAGLLELNEQIGRIEGAKVQVAEQYQYHPMQEARLRLIRSGRLGRITEATVSISHLYHGASLIRKMLGVGFEEARIRAMRFETEWVNGPTRGGPPADDKLIPTERELAWIDFGDRLGIYDFTSNQHRSWIRSNHISVRGQRGEIFDNRVLIQQDAVQMQLELKRVNRGELENAEGYFLQGIIGGEQWLYTNPFVPARLYDDEIAIASCLQQMSDYINGGPELYNLAEASQDQYLGLLIQRAILTGETVIASRQGWAMTEG